MPDPADAELLDDPSQARTGAGEALDDLLVDVVGSDGRMLWASEAQLRTLGLPADVFCGLPLEAVYAPDSCETISELLRRAEDGGHASSCELTLIGRGGRSIRTLARPRFQDWRGRTALRLTKMDYGPIALQHAAVADNARLLGKIVEHSKEAHWAIVFLEPVDITQHKAEVVRQVFENQSIWRMCNKPMARLYDLPDDLDLNAQQVRLYWPRSPANERFVEQIIDADYEIDNALSVDSRHDGTPIYIRNDVRAEIVDGFLRRLWGNCRDTTDQQAEQAERENAMCRVFDAVPQAVVVFDGRGGLITRNRAFRHAYGEAGPLEDRLARQLRRGRPRPGWHALTLTLDGARTALRVHWDQAPGVDGETWNVATLVPGAQAVRVPRGATGGPRA